MKEESIELAFQQGSSDKVYQATLSGKRGNWSVAFAYGRRGTALNFGNKTSKPVAYDVAKKTYDKLVNSKLAKGYQVSRSNGAAMPATTVSEKKATGILPQLLNEIEENQVATYIKDPNFCAQEKSDGRRKMIKIPEEKGANVIGINKLGFEVALDFQMILEANTLSSDIVLDGEDMGDHIMIFDSVDVARPYNERYSDLSSMLIGKKHLKFVHTAWTTKDKQAMFDRLKKEGAEGIVFKDIHSKYTPGRPNRMGPMLKYKFYATASCIVLDVHKTKRSVSLYVFAGGAKIPIGNVTVYPNQPMPKPEDIVEIKYLYWYDGGSLYQPVLLGIRDDIDDKECTIKQLKAKSNGK